MSPRSRLALLPLLLGVTAPAHPAVPQDVLVSGTDYAFQVPRTIHAGETRFAFENRGTVRHEMSIALLKEGFGLDSVMAGIVAGSPRRNFVDGQAALIVARPGEAGGAAGPRLWLNLLPGRTYLVLCTLRDTPDAAPHVTMGMAASFRAE